MKDKKIQEKEKINMQLQNKEKVQELKEKGITLIALVVTIIILLILVGVTISQLSGENGLIRKAKEVAEKYKNASEEELIQLGQLEQYVTDKVNSNLLPTSFSFRLSTSGSSGGDQYGTFYLDKSLFSYITIDFLEGSVGYSNYEKDYPYIKINEEQEKISFGKKYSIKRG